MATTTASKPEDRIDSTKKAALDAGAQAGVAGTKAYTSAQASAAADRKAALASLAAVGKTSGFNSLDPTLTRYVTGGLDDRAGGLRDSQAAFEAASAVGNQSAAAYLDAAKGSVGAVNAAAARSRGGGGGGGGNGTGLTDAQLTNSLMDAATQTRLAALTPILGEAKAKAAVLADLNKERGKTWTNGNSTERWNNAKALYVKDHREVGNWIADQMKTNKELFDIPASWGDRTERWINALVGLAKRQGKNPDQVARYMIAQYGASHADMGPTSKMVEDRTGIMPIGGWRRREESVPSAWDPILQREASGKGVWDYFANRDKQNTARRKALDAFISQGTKDVQEREKQGRAVFDRPLTDYAREIGQRNGLNARALAGLSAPGLDQKWDKAYADAHNIDYSGKGRATYTFDDAARDIGLAPADIPSALAEADGKNIPLYKRTDNTWTTDQNDENIVYKTVKLKDDKEGKPLPEMKSVPVMDWLAQDAAETAKKGYTYQVYASATNPMVEEIAKAMPRAYRLAVARARAYFPDVQEMWKGTTDPHLASYLELANRVLGQ